MSLGWIEVFGMNERLRNGLLNMGLVVMSVVVFFVMLEGYFAVFDPQIRTIEDVDYDSTNWSDFFQYDEVLGWVNKPNAYGIDLTNEWETQIRINSKGIRDRNYEYKKPEGIKRMVVLGDSFTYGKGVEEYERFTEVLENSLLENYQVINMGVTGYGNDQELLVLKNEGMKYNPDLVVVAFYVGNDIDDNTHTVRYTYPKSMFVLDNNNKLNLTNVPVPQKEEIMEKWDVKNNDNVTLFYYFKNYVKTNSHAYAFIAPRITGSPNILNLFKKIGIADKETQLVGAYGFYYDYNWNLTKVILKEIDTVAKTNDSKTIIVIIPTVNWLHENFDPELNRALFDFGKNNNIAILDLFPEFREHVKNGEQLYFKIDGHWNANGHKLAAELIYNKVIEEKLI